MGAHAILSASGAHRWMACPGSARFEAQFNEETSEYAEEGRFAHALAELQLGFSLGNITHREYNKNLKTMQENPLYSPVMAEYIEQYTTFVQERVADACNRCKDPIVLLEQRLDFSEWVPEGFGTGDVVIIADGTLEVIDLKYGQGVPVDAAGNPQLRLYGLGAYALFSPLYDIEGVRMTICQPRLDSLSSETRSAVELIHWGETEIRPKAELAFSGKGGFCAGEHCKFCRGRAMCRARAEYNLELARYDFTAPQSLTDDEIAEILGKITDLQSWAKDVSEYALTQARDNGIYFPGWKLVEGRSNRKYTDEEQVVATLLAAKYDADLITPRVLLGITAMEKEIGKKKFNELLSGLVEKPPGKPTLVPESDKRPALNSTQTAIEDFSEKKGA
jgi:hypothetical protein